MSVNLEQSLKAIRALPDALRSRVALVPDEGKESLFISDELRGNIEIINLVCQLTELGVGNIEFLTPKKFDADCGHLATRTGLGETDIQQMAIDLIAKAYKSGATDMLLVDEGSSFHARFRILGMLRPALELDGDTGRRLIRTIYEHLGASQDSPTFDAISQLDGRIANRDYLPHGVHSVRIHCEPIECETAENGLGTFMALRLISDSTGAAGGLEERLERLGFTNDTITLVDVNGNERRVAAQTSIFRTLANKNGMVLISGCTGSGKSTALAHTMEALIEERPGDNFLSVEDPPEKPIRGMYQIRVNSKADTARAGGLSAYTKAIAGTNRDDADLVMIGEIRYPDAAMAAIEVAQSGHAVWATIHASDALGILTRLETMLRSHIGEPLRTLCDPTVLSGVEYQRLIAKLCPYCKKPLREHRDALPQELFERLQRAMPVELLLGDAHHDGIFLRNENGCEHCRQSGHAGLFRQTVVSEVIAIDPTMLAILRDGNMEEAKGYWLTELHGMTYLEHARYLLAQGIIDPIVAEDQLSMPLDYDIALDRKTTAQNSFVMPSVDFSTHQSAFRHKRKKR